MKLNILTQAALFTAISLVTPSISLSQPSSRGERVPGFWQPRVDVNPNRPILVRLLNETELPVRYSLSPYPDRSLSPGLTADVPISISSKQADFANINIYSSEELIYDYNADNNIVTVRIRSVGKGPRADKAVYIDERGRVYSF